MRISFPFYRLSTTWFYPKRSLMCYTHLKHTEPTQIIIKIIFDLILLFDSLGGIIILFTSRYYCHGNWEALDLIIKLERRVKSIRRCGIEFLVNYHTIFNRHLMVGKYRRISDISPELCLFMKLSQNSKRFIQNCTI